MALSSARRLAGLTPVQLLVLVAVAELSITRLAVPTLEPRPPSREMPAWFEVLDNVGLFLLYFGTTLAIAILAMRAWDVLRTRAQVPILEALGRLGLAAALLACAVICGLAVVVEPAVELSLAVHAAYAVALIALIIAAIARRSDLGTTLGAAVLVVPLLVHVAAVFVGNLVLSEDQLAEGSLIESARDLGLHMVVLAALVTPYCLAPRPVVRAVTRLGPLIVGLVIGSLGALLVRHEYKAAIELGSDFVGVDLSPGVPAGDMALYLLALATLAWTLTSTAIAESPARREVGAGLGLVVLGGYGFAWPFYFLLGVVGIAVILDAAPRLREEEAPSALRPRTPAIDDETWQGWVTQLASALRADDADLKTVTVRADDDTSTTVLVGERHGVPYKARFGRLAGALVSIDVVCGREVAESQRATFTVYARPEGTRESHPPPPPASPTVHVDDTSFSVRFRTRGDAEAFARMLDEPLRARASALLDGWVAWWEGVSLRYRVFPAIGAPLDHPVPISDLAMRGAGTVERMTGAIDLLTAIAARGLGAEPGGHPEPAVLD